jgi:hypothetical protein
MALPPWLEQLRRELITRVVRGDPRTSGESLLGLPGDRIRSEVIGGGQADFVASWTDPFRDDTVLSPDDRVLLYAYWNQLRHIEELVHAFKDLFGTSMIEDPVVIDLGCGPFTGGLALGSVLGQERSFTYIGVDRAPAMHRLGETLATAAVERRGMADVARHWIEDLDALSWTEPPKWRPVVVIVSYLLASPTLDATFLVAQLERALARLGRGSVTVLYTNSPNDMPNRAFPEFHRALEAAGFALRVDDRGAVETERWGGSRTHELRYALFYRQSQTTLCLDGE